MKLRALVFLILLISLTSLISLISLIHLTLLPHFPYIPRLRRHSSPSPFSSPSSPSSQLISTHLNSSQLILIHLNSSRLVSLISLTDYRVCPSIAPDHLRVFGATVPTWRRWASDGKFTQLLHQALQHARCTGHPVKESSLQSQLLIDVCSLPDLVFPACECRPGPFFYTFLFSLFSSSFSFSSLFLLFFRSPFSFLLSLLSPSPPCSSLCFSYFSSFQCFAVRQRWRSTAGITTKA